jgi:MFS family permease
VLQGLCYTHFPAFLSRRIAIMLNEILSKFGVKPFYGWSVLAGLFFVYAASNGVLMHTIPLLYPNLINEFGWTEAQVTLPATMLYVVGAITSPPAGVLLDRYSPRRIVITGACGIVVGLLLTAGFDELWQLVAIFILFGAALSLSGLVSNMLILSRWFHRFRGKATGILLMASSLGGVVFPLIMGWGLLNWGWRPTMIGFALLVALMMLVPLLFVIRDRPEDVGVTIDGQPETNIATKKSSSASGPTLRDAMRGRNFYLIALATGSVWFAIIAMIQHQGIYLGRDLGVSGALLPLIFSTFFACSVIGKFGFGFLSDHFHKDRVMMVSVLLLIAGLLLLRTADASQTTSLFAYAAVAGIGFSGSFTCVQLMIATHYAGPSYGKILAIMMLMDTLAGALGTRVIANMRGSFESYQPAFNLLVLVCLVAVVCIALLQKPSKANPVQPNQSNPTNFNQSITE